MKICIYGAGAIGGYIVVQLANAGFDVTLIARGQHLDAIRKNGLTLHIDGEIRSAQCEATDDPSSLGVQDYVLVTLKSHSLPGIVNSMQPLLGPDTAVVSAVNGIPWWYCHGLESPLGERHIEAVDPGGHIWRTIGPERALGCVVYPSAEIVSPGILRHISDNKLSLGEPDGARSQRVKSLAAALMEAGFKAPVRTHLRDEIWIKLWGNLSFNPLSALTGANLDALAKDPGDEDDCPANDAGGTSHWGKNRSAVQHRCGQTHRGCSGSWRAPHVDVAGSRSWASTGNRGAGRVGAGTRSSCATANADHRYHPCDAHAANCRS